MYDTLEFPFPVFLTTWHLFFSVSYGNARDHRSEPSRGKSDGQAVSTRILQRTTTLVDGARDIEMTVSVFLYTWSLSVVCGRYVPCGVSTGHGERVGK